MKDNSEYYTEALALREEVDWILHRPHAKIAEWLLPRIAANKCETVIEFGCGSGILAAMLPEKSDYLGIDSNPHFIRMARNRKPGWAFVKDDVRYWSPEKTYELAMAWSLFKHFSLNEWNAIVACVLVHGRFGAFNVQLSDRDFDDGVDYHHAHVTEAHLAEALAMAGHEEVERQVFNDWSVNSAPARDVAIWTKRK
jgi:trans-aconitate methyltransferase